MSRDGSQGGPPGRGSISNPTGRFEPTQIDGFDDGWGSLDETPPPLRTTVTIDATKSIITRNDSPDIFFDRSINPYRGCEHGCVYCFARPTHAYLGLSPGLDFESKLFAKPRAAQLLDRELRRPGYRCGTIAMGTNTDPYQPIDRRFAITREILEVLSRFQNPVSIVTKSNLVLRDRDLLAGMAARRLASVCLSVTTLRRDLARRMEPRAPTPQRRLECIRALSEAGVPVGVLVAPIIPGLNDEEIEEILAACAEAGARTAGYVLLRLPLELAQLFEEWLEAHYPEKKARVLHLIRETRDGAMYQSSFGMRQRGTGPIADLIRQRFERARGRLRVFADDSRFDLDTTRFRVPPAPGDTLPLFDPE